MSRIEALEARMAELAKQTADARHEERDVQQAAKAAGEKSADVDRWIKALHDKSENVAFSATLELARLKDPRAVDPLIAVLRHHNDFYVRLGAAVALGDIEALDAVEYLIDALDDKDALVRTAASDALQKITGGRIAIAQGATPEERKQGQEAWRLFWKENEARLRDDA